MKKIKLFIIRIQKRFWLILHHYLLKKAVLVHTVSQKTNEDKYNKIMKKYYYAIYKCNELFFQEMVLK